MVQKKKRRIAGTGQGVTGRPRTLWLNLLPTLDAILNSRTLTEAAERAHLTQPALSIALSKARTHFNDELVVYRLGRSELTELGSTLRRRVRVALEASRDVLDCELTFDPATSTRTVRILANAYVEVVLMPRLIARIHAEAPFIDFNIQRIGQLPPKPDGLEKVDIIFGAKYFANENYAYADLFSDRFKCLVWEKHPTVKDEISMPQYLQLRHANTIIPNDRSPMLMRKTQEMHRTSLLTPSAAALPFMIVGTDLIVTSISRYCDMFARLLPLRTVPLLGDVDTRKDLSMDAVVLWKPHRSSEPFIKWLIAICQDVAREI